MLNEILINNCKCKIIFLIKGMNNIRKEFIPKKYRFGLDQLMKELQEYITPEEYTKFLADCLDIELKDPIEQAEDIIKKFYENRGLNNGGN